MAHRLAGPARDDRGAGDRDCHHRHHRGGPRDRSRAAGAFLLHPDAIELALLDGLGAWFLTAHGALSALWLLLGWFRLPLALTVLAWPVAIVALLATSYTGFLFAQGLGRDLWQGPHAAIHLIAQSGAAGAASLLIAALFVPPQDAGSVEALTWVLGGSVSVHVLILLFDNVFTPSPTRHHELALETIRRGPYARLFWGVAVAAGGVLPLLLVLVTTSLPLGLEIASVLALAGSAAWEYIWVEAGQSVPLS